MKKILFFGDSITDATRDKEGEIGSLRSYGLGYVMQIAGRILKDAPNDYTIINRGISGNRTCDLHARVKWDVWHHEPDVLSILIGVNDVWHEIKQNNGVEIERFELLYDMLLTDTFKRLPNVKMILLEPFVLKGTATEEDYDRFLEVKKYAKVVKKLADKYKLPFVPLQDKFDEMSEKFGVELYLADGVHPNIAGTTLIAEEWIKHAKENKLI